MNKKENENPIFNISCSCIEIFSGHNVNYRCVQDKTLAGSLNIELNKSIIIIYMPKLNFQKTNN